MKDIQVCMIGVKAHALISQTQEATVCGVTSSGIFLRLSCGWIVFLTQGNFRGPLTLNLTSPLNNIVTPGSQVSVRPDAFLFPAAEVTVSFRQAALWSPALRPIDVLSPTQRLTQLNCLVDQVSALRSVNEINTLLSVLLSQEPESIDQHNIVSEGFHSLQRSLRERQPAEANRALEKLLGWGPGLTPLGDDLICGFFLALSRWGDMLAPGFSLAAIEQVILPMAYRRSTLLSANLIECAANGLADERLVFALDGVVTGMPACETCAELLLGWGNSSGLAALCGMAVLLSSTF